MAYLVIAVGLLMSLAGGTLLNYGYAIVQVERGWSSVIAGSVFLTGGLVTMGLGLVLRAVADVRRGLVDAAAVARTVVGADSTSPTTAAVAPPPLPQAMEPSFASRDGDPYAPPAAGDALPHEPVPTEREPAEADRGPSRAATVSAGHDGHHAADIPATPPRSEEPPPGDTLPPPTAPASRDAIAEPPAMDDWLDRAFSDMDRLSPPHTPAQSAFAREVEAFGNLGVPAPRREAPASTEPPHAATIHAEPAHAEPVHAEPVHAEPVQTEPPHAAPPPSPAPPPHDSPVIGRYESDDTSYVMYADGSIEAQSPAGVYRFSSMAELKAFIEG